MKKVIALALLAGVVAGAQAQVGKPLGLSVRAGAVFPSERAARDLDHTWLAFGAEYKLRDLDLKFTNPAYSASLSVSLDYYAKDDARATPILLNYVGNINQFFYTGGVGVGLNRNLDGDGKNTFAYQLGVGYNFQQGSTPLFAEVKYFGHTGGSTKLNGIGAYLGIRF